MADLNQLIKKLVILSDELAALLQNKDNEKDIPAANANAAQKFEVSSKLLSEILLVVDDLKYTIKTTDEDQKAIYNIFLDCATSLKNLFAQMDVGVKRASGVDFSKAGENPKVLKKWKKFVEQMKSTLELVDDNARGILETFGALSESQAGGGVSVKPTVPVTIVTGFLGSGKTTFLNYILSANHGKRIAVIENEFGEVGIDDALVKDKFSGEEEIFQMNNGCICCTVRGDLIKALGALLEKSEKFDYIMIETTGLADPAPIVQTFFSVPEIGARLRVDGIVTLVDAKHILKHLEEKSQQGVVNEAEQQIAFADVVLLNKTDLITPEELVETKSIIQSINKMVEIHPTQRSVIPLNKILNIRSFDLNKITELDPEVLLREQHDHDHEHDPKEQKITKHHIGSLVTSVGIVIEGECKMQRLNAWMGQLLREKGADIYRMKGVLAIENMNQAFVFQAVHMILDANPGATWPDEKRINKLVFIGKNLNRTELEEGFKNCMTQK